jgi:hypothetical protein
LQLHWAASLAVVVKAHEGSLADHTASMTLSEGGIICPACVGGIAHD